jgi:hypothetical protein
LEGRTSSFTGARRETLSDITCIERPLAKEGVVDFRTLELFPRLRADLIAAAADPCTVLQRGLTEEEGAIFDLLTTVNLKLRLARGLAFIDDKVVTDERYLYQLRGVLRGGGEVILGPEVGVWAGHFILPAPPEDLTGPFPVGAKP